MSNAAQAYSRTSQTTASPREIEAQALLKAARQLLDVQTNWNGPDKNMHNALMFNRRLWSIFMSAAETNDNQQPMEIRQNIANIGVFVMKQTIDMQLNPDPAKLKSLIDINCNLAARPWSGRGRGNRHDGAAPLHRETAAPPRSSWYRRPGRRSRRLRDRKPPG